MRKFSLAAAWVAAVTLGFATAGPRKPATPAQLATAVTEIAGLDADQKAKMQGLFGHYIDEAKAAKKPAEMKKLDEQAWTELHALLTPAQEKKLWNYVARENEKERKDRAEDIRDKKEDIKDKLEDLKDKRKKGGKAEKKEDIRDKKEDIRDRLEDKFDRKDDAIDAKDEVRYWLNGLKLRVGSRTPATSPSK